MSLNPSDKYPNIFLDYAALRTSVTDISMDSNDTSPASITSKPGNSYDDYEQNNRSTFSSDASIRESIMSNHSKENAIERVTPRSSFTTLEEQLEYLRLDKTETTSRFVDDADAIKPQGVYSSKLNSLLFPKVESSFQEGRKSDLASGAGSSYHRYIGKPPLRAQEYPSHLPSASKSSEKSILNYQGYLKAASEDAYESTSNFLSVRKAVSEDTFEDNQVSTKLIYYEFQTHSDLVDRLQMFTNKVLGIRSESPTYNVPAAMNHAVRRESYPITRPIQARPAAGIGIAQMQMQQHQGVEVSAAGANQVTTSNSRPVHSMQTTSSVPWPSPNQMQNASNHNQHSSPQPPQLYPSTGAGMITTPPRPSSNVVYQVQFKRKIRHFVTAANSALEIHVGDYVKVEADRGEDLGVVHGIITVPTYLDLRRQHHLVHGSKDEDGAWDLKQVIRLASTYERRQLPNKALEEIQVTQNAYDLAQNVYGLPMTIVDAEFQFDRHKLIIYYDSNK
jgi:hypothetical protein